MTHRLAVRQVRATDGRHTLRKVAQGTAQTLLQHRMVEWHGQHVRHGHLPFDREGQQVRQVFGGWHAHLGGQEPTGLALGVKAQQARGGLGYAGARLIREIRVSRDSSVFIQIRQRWPDPRHLRR